MVPKIRSTCTLTPEDHPSSLARAGHIDCLRWQQKYPKLCAWVEENIEETLTFYRSPREHHKHLNSTNMLERINPNSCYPHLS
jgi:transposase-like protein